MFDIRRWTFEESPLNKDIRQSNVQKFGDNGREDTPVPIPNTAVKLSYAESTWGAGPWEDR